MLLNMRKELDDLLCERYPVLFSDRHTSPYETGMCWGFTCGDGWFDHIDRLCSAISLRVEDGISPPVVAQEVKEKFGRLCFRFRGGDDEIRRLVRLWEDLSETTCETCGRSGASYLGVRQGVLCPECLATASTPII